MKAIDYLPRRPSSTSSSTSPGRRADGYHPPIRVFALLAVGLPC